MPRFLGSTSYDLTPYFIFLIRYNSFIEDGELEVKDGCLASSAHNINLHDLICSLLGEEMLPPFCQ